MGRPELLPTRQIIKWLEQGLRNKDIIELLAGGPYYLSGVQSNHLSVIRRRAGLPRSLPDYSDMIPWTLSDKHQRHWPAAMLRLESRVRRGATEGKVPEEVLEPQALKDWQSWRKKFEETPQVLTYVEHDVDGQGWYYLPRTPEDTDIIRR